MGLVFPILVGAASPSGSVEHINCAESRNFWLRSTEAEKYRYCLLIKKVRLNAHSEPERAERFLNQAFSVYPHGDLGFLERARLLYLGGETEKARTILWQVLSPQPEDYPDYHLLAAHILASLGEREASAIFYHRLLRSRQLPAAGRPRAKVFLEAALIFSGTKEEGEESSLSLLLRAQGEDAPLLEPFFEPVRVLLKIRAENTFIEAQNKASQQRQEVKRPSNEVQAKYYPSLAWVFARLKSGRGRASEVLPVFSPAEPWAILAAAAYMDANAALTKEMHVRFLDVLKKEEKPPYLSALLRAPRVSSMK